MAIYGGHKGVFGMDNEPCYRTDRIYIESEKYAGVDNPWLLNECLLLCKYIKKKACSIQTIGGTRYHILENAFKLITENRLPIRS